MSQSGPPVDLARGDRVASYRVTSVLGHGREGVAASVTDEFLRLPRLLKAYPAEPEWIERLRHVAHRCTELAELGACPRPLNGGLGLTSRSEPIAYLVFERRLGRPLDRLLQEASWDRRRCRQLVFDLARLLARVHATGSSIGDFEAGNNVVLVQGQPLFVDIGLVEPDDTGQHYEDDLEYLASIARILGERSGDGRLSELALSLDNRREGRLGLPPRGDPVGRCCQSNDNLPPGGRSSPKPERRLARDCAPLSQGG